MTDLKAVNNKFQTIKTTVSALGPNLPIGLKNPAGTFETDLRARPWRLKEEKELARLRTDDANFFSYISTILGTMLQKIGPANFDEVKDTVARKLTVGQMYMADVFYAYIWLRIQAIGPELTVPVKCPKCKHAFDFAGDLRTTEITVPVNKSDIEWEFTLRDPVNIRNREVKGFRIGQQLWSAYTNSGVTEEGSKATVIVNSVRGFLGDVDPVKGLPYDQNILSDELDELSKYDLEKLVKEIDDKFLGPKMAIDAVCIQEKCKFEWVVPLNWTYDSFFAVSSV